MTPELQYSADLSSVVLVRFNNQSSNPSKLPSIHPNQSSSLQSTMSTVFKHSSLHLIHYWNITGIGIGVGIAVGMGIGVGIRIGIGIGTGMDIAIAIGFLLAWPYQPTLLVTV